MARTKIDSGWLWTCDIAGCDEETTTGPTEGCPATWRFVPRLNEGGPPTWTACPDHVAPLDAHAEVRIAWRIAAGDDPEGYAISNPMADPPWV